MSKIKGIRSTRRLIRRLPDGMRAEIIQTLRGVGPEIAAAMTARVPRSTGRLARGIAWRVYPASMRLRVGFIGKVANRKLFYGFILNYGRKAQVANAKRISKSGKISTYTINVTRLAPRPFVTGPLTELRTSLNRRLKNVWDRVLSKVAAGND